MVLVPISLINSFWVNVSVWFVLVLLVYWYWVTATWLRRTKQMAASSTCASLSVSNITLLSARCTGFAKVKGQNDYAFIIDLEWSDERAMSIKRTYAQFQTFHANLTKLFPELRQTIKSKLRLQTSKYMHIQCKKIFDNQWYLPAASTKSV